MYACARAKFRIQCQRPLVFGDALSRAVRKSLHKAQDEMSYGMVRRQEQRLRDGRLGCGEIFYPIVGQKIDANRKINQRCAEQRLNIFRFERQGPVKEAARLCQVFGGSAPVDPSGALEAQVSRIGMR
jgi:hypothetical protein